MTKKFNVTVKWINAETRTEERRTYKISVTDREEDRDGHKIWNAKQKAIRKANKESGYELNMARNIVSCTEA